jgi:Uma2 family endonuclease
MATEGDLRRMPDDEWKYELVDGEIRAEPRGGMRHSRVCVVLATCLGLHVEQAHLGSLFASNTGFRLPNGNVRAPDLSFLSSGRVSEIPDGFAPLAPDLAVEVLAPHDRPRIVLDRVGDYLEAGSRLVWVIDPEARRAATYRSATEARGLSAKDVLDGDDVVPGFRCTLADVLR